MDDLVQRLRGWGAICTEEAADRIEQLERENAELRQKLASVPLTQFPQSFRDNLAEAIRLGKVTIS